MTARQDLVKRERAVPAPTSRIKLPYLRAWRVKALLTQVQLAELSHVSEPTIIRAEGGGLAGALTAERLARALNVTVEQLQSEKPQ